MFTKQTKFIIATAVQFGIIFSIIIFKVAILIGGTEVFLKVAPVDPRDPLRGDHLTFQYEISNIDRHYFAYSPIKDGDTVYIPLRQAKKYWRPIPGIQKVKPTDEKELFIKGKVLSSYGQRIRIVYGIEEYFIPEGMGQDFNWRAEVSAKVVVDENGNSVLKQIYVDDKPWP